RLKEAVVTGAGLFPSLEPRHLLLAVVLAAGLVAVASRRQADRTTTLLVSLVAVLYAMRLLDGFGFVPGLLAAAPLAAVALAHGRTDREARVPLLFALAALPLVWVTQYTGGAAPQWAGRYILPSMLV